MGDAVSREPLPDLPIGAAFHESLADGWSSGYSDGGFGRRLAAIRSVLERQVRPGSKWVDLGCGSGVLTSVLLDLGASVTAIDGSPAMLAAARAKLGDNPAVTFIQSDVCALEAVPEASVDGILCSSVIEYCTEPPCLLREAARICSAGGCLILTVPPKLSAVRSAQKLARKLLALVGRRKFTYLEVSRFEVRPDAIAPWLAAEGFCCDRVTGFDPFIGGWVPFLRPSLLIIEAKRSSLK